MPTDRRLLRALGALMIAVAAALVGVGWLPAAADTYEVRSGDTLSEIAQRLRVDESVILALNGEIASADSIYIGQILQVPDNAQRPGSTSATASADESAASAVHTYQVQGGDTLTGIADQFGTTVAALIALNPDVDPDVLFVGQDLLVGGGGGSGAGSQALTARSQARPLGPSATRAIEYIVQPNQYASEIADAHGISLDLLRQRNPNVNLDIIHPGQVLLIPIPDYRAPAIDPSEDASGLTDVYIVRPGDYASLIAERYGVSLGALRELNGGISLATIFIGQRLTVPWVGTSSEHPPGTVPAVEVRNRTHRVQAGDTFANVAAFYSLSMEELRALNPLRPSDLLVIGERLILPGVIDPPIVAETRTLGEADVVQYAAASLGVTPRTLLANYPSLGDGDWLSADTSWRLPLREGQLITVQAGDTLESIANALGVSIDRFLDDPSLGVDDPNQLVIGQEIILPFDMPSFGWPAQGELTDPFGLCRSWDCSYRHRGLDIALDYWVPIVASADGVVTFVGGDAALGLGWYVEVEHENGWKTVYAHLVEFNVWNGQTVARGDVLGYNGNSGFSTGPHLHFEVQFNDWYIDPLVVLP